MENPFETPQNTRVTEDGLYDDHERALANRNSGTLLETLALDVTPTGAHYLLTHFDVPLLDAASHRLRFHGAFATPYELCVDEIRALPEVTLPVTLECAGNGRAGLSPRRYSMPWGVEAVGTTEWTGTPLAPLIADAGPLDGVVDFSFTGADFGYDKGVGHHFGRSLTPQQLADLNVLLVHSMNGQPLLPQHGAPLRIVVPGWYGMASVKWLTDIEALTERYSGFQQVETYCYRQIPDGPSTPVTELRVKSLMVPPGAPDWITRTRCVAPGKVEMRGKAWSGAGRAITRVEFAVDGVWQEAELTGRAGQFAWTGWRATWQAEPGAHVLQCRATDEAGDCQPLTPPWDVAGFGNNAAQAVHVIVPE